MLNLNVEDLINNTKELEELINTYENNAMIIARELQNAEISWHDEHSGAFFDDISTLKNQLSNFIDNLKNIKLKYRTVIDEVKKIDRNIKKLFLDFDKKETIIISYNNAINKLYEAKNKIRYLNISFCTYNEQTRIKNEYNRISKNIKKLEASKTKVSNMINKICNLESRILSLFAKITMNSIREID